VADGRSQLPNWLDRAASAHPQKVALQFGSYAWSFSELQRSVLVTAAVLEHKVRGQPSPVRVGVLSANRPAFVFAVSAAPLLKVSIVPLNWRQTPEEIRWQLEHSAIRVLVVDRERLPLAESATRDLPISILGAEDLEHERLPSRPLRTTRHIHLDDEALVMYTSGTTGRPKGARLTYGNLWYSAVGSALYLGHRLDDIWLQTLPLFHIGGLSILYRGVIGAVTVVLHERFDPESALAALAGGVTMTSFVPTTLARLLDCGGDQPWTTSLRHVLIGGSATPPALVDAALQRGIPIAPTYGLTETASQASTLLAIDAARKPRSSGLPLPTTDIRIAEHGRVLPAGEIGQIEVRGPSVFAGYLDESGVSPTRADGWFQTGDAGYLDHSGYVFVVDRRDDLLVTGGENVYPAEIERVLLEHTLVADAGVVGRNDADWGARPVAAVVWRGDVGQAAAVLAAYCRNRLATYKIPDVIVEVAELPRSASGKLLRRQLRDSLQIETGQALRGHGSLTDQP
jgi:O-succinylbenzoic acid--CoA ligase